MAEQAAETAHTCLTSAGSPVCPKCREDIYEQGALLAQRADWEREQYRGVRRNTTP